MPVKDAFVNQAYLSITESGANTLTFSKLETGISIHEKVGWIIHRIDYQVGIDMTNFEASGDFVVFGISTSSAIVEASLAESAVVDHNQYARRDIGTAASGFIFKQPFEKSFAGLPGGGILIPPNPIFVFVKGSNLTSAISLSARMFYTVRELKLEDFWELVELRRMIGT